MSTGQRYVPLRLTPGFCLLNHLLDFYLLAFGPLRTVFTDQELQDFADAMADRGVRMRQSLEDVIDVRANLKMQADSEEDSESGDPLDEIERNAQELRRLRPY